MSVFLSWKYKPIILYLAVIVACFVLAIILFMEVDEFLDNIIKDYESYNKEILALQEENDRLNAKIDQLSKTHHAGMEVILDVVYNHTAEGNNRGPTLIDEILEEHAIIRGKTELLDMESEKILRGIKITRYGFEGMASDKNKAYEIFGKEVVYDKATLEDILLFYTRGDENA